MTISRKIIISIIGVVVLAFIAVYVISEVTLSASFRNIETMTMQRNISRVNIALSQRLDNLEIFNEDWANWDETYRFAADGNPDYIDRNFTDENFEYAKLNFMAVVDLDKNVIYRKAYDLNTHQEIPVPQELETYLTNDLLVLQSDTSPGTVGVVSVSDTAMLISAKPILTSYLEGPTNGTLIFGRFIDTAMVNNLTDTIQRSVTIWPAEGTPLPDDVVQAITSFTETDTDYIHLLDREYIAGYTLVTDIFGNPAFIFKISALREITQQGQRAILYLIIVLAVVCILFSWLYFHILKHTFLKRLTAVTKNVNDISKTGQIVPVKLSGNDELSGLSENIDNMLAKLKQTSTELNSQKTLTDRILEFSPNIVFVIDNDFNITMANKAFCDIFGVIEAEVVNQPLSKFVAMEEFAVLTQQFEASGATKLNTSFRYKINGVEKTFDIAIVTMSQDEYLLICKDVTEENALRERFYLNDRLASIGEMAAGIAHELNNPLTGIIMLSQTIMQDNIPEELKRDMIDINNEACRASEVVKNLLAFARKQAPSKRLTQINNTIAGVIKLREYELTVNNINLVTDLDPNLPETLVDNVQIQQVFLNLILNAEYSMTKAHNGGTFRIRSYQANDKVIVSFTDDGMGIKDEDMKKLFQPFFTTKEVGVGTGLGLSLCYGIIQRHNGAIYAQSKWGRGATFTVELPINTNETNEK